MGARFLWSFRIRKLCVLLKVCKRLFLPVLYFERDEEAQYFSIPFHLYERAVLGYAVAVSLSCLFS